MDTRGVEAIQNWDNVVIGEVFGNNFEFFQKLGAEEFQEKINNPNYSRNPGQDLDDYCTKCPVCQQKFKLQGTHSSGSCDYTYLICKNCKLFMTYVAYT